MQSIACIFSHWHKIWLFLFQVDFDQFKNALILVLSSAIEAPPQEDEGEVEEEEEEEEQEVQTKPGRITR